MLLDFGVYSAMRMAVQGIHVRRSSAKLRRPLRDRHAVIAGKSEAGAVVAVARVDIISLTEQR